MLLEQLADHRNQIGGNQPAPPSTKTLACHRMQPDSKTGRLERRQPLRQQCTSYSRQHIAEPSAGHSWMPAITQCKPAVAVGDQGSGALEQYGTTEARSKSARGGWSRRCPTIVRPHRDAV